MNLEQVPPKRSLAEDLQRAQENVERAAKMFSDPTKTPGPSGESNEEELKKELEEAIRERQRAQARIDEQKHLH